VSVVACAVLGIAAGCASSQPAAFPGRSQSASFQTALRTCLVAKGITYHPVVHEPGSVAPLVPAPAPAEWWALHGGYGLIDDQHAETALDPSWVDPNVAEAERATSHRWTRSLYGTAGSPERFDQGSCYDRALRRAGFFAESRVGTGLRPTPDQARAAAASTPVVRAQQRRSACLVEAGIDPAMTHDPEGSLRRRFVGRDLISTDAVHAPGASADQLRAARQLEERVARADARCGRTVGLDRAVDVALRRQIDGTG
jgi:hypothetical protein